MDLILAGLTWQVCLVFLDDVIVYGSTLEEHLHRLKTVFERLAVANLKLKPTKRHLFQKRIAFLGHIVSEHWIELNPGKLNDAISWSKPRNLTIGSFRRPSWILQKSCPFVCGYCPPATGIHKKWTAIQMAVLFMWSRAIIPQVEKLSDFCADISHTKWRWKVYLDTDASDFALGAILQQKQNGVSKVIGYASRALNAAEQSYCITRNE